MAQFGLSSSFHRIPKAGLLSRSSLSPPSSSLSSSFLPPPLLVLPLMHANDDDNRDTSAMMAINPRGGGGEEKGRGDSDSITFQLCPCVCVWKKKKKRKEGRKKGQYLQLYQPTNHCPSLFSRPHSTEKERKKERKEGGRKESHAALYKVTYHYCSATSSGKRGRRRLAKNKVGVQQESRLISTLLWFFFAVPSPSPSPPPLTNRKCFQPKKQQQQKVPSPPPPPFSLHLDSVVGGGRGKGRRETRNVKIPSRNFNFYGLEKKEYRCAWLSASLSPFHPHRKWEERERERERSFIFPPFLPVYLFPSFIVHEEDCKVTPLPPPTPSTVRV